MRDDATVIAFPVQSLNEEPPAEEPEIEFEDWLAAEMADFQCSATYLDEHLGNPESLIAEVARMRQQLASWEPRLRDWSDG